jgi:hypothetical protein
MIKLFGYNFIFVIIPVSYVHSQSPIQPQLIHGKVVLGADVVKAIKSKNPNFKMLTLNNFAVTSIENSSTSPMAVLADFNGDQKTDVAIYGMDRANNKALIYMLISKAQSYEAFEVEKAELNASVLVDNESYLTKNRLAAKNKDVLFVEYFSSDESYHITYYFSNSKHQVFMYDSQGAFHP